MGFGFHAAEQAHSLDTSRPRESPVSGHQSRVCLIANPAAGRGRGARLLPAIREALAARGVNDVRLTGAPGDEHRLARDAAREGVDTIIALGGDGTWGNAARGILESGKDARLAILAAGTGNDFGHTLGIPATDPRAMIDIALAAREQRVDVGRVGGVPFLNVAGFGIQTSVLEATRKARFLRGHMLYFVAALPRLMSFQALEAQVSTDSREPGDAGRYVALIVANGPRFGGGFRIAPTASITDGALDFLAVRDTHPARRALIFGRARLGSHLGLREVEHRQVGSLTLTFTRPPSMDVDGELMLARSERVDVVCLPRALRVAVP